jgi:hypothetical protein
MMAGYAAIAAARKSLAFAVKVLTPGVLGPAVHPADSPNTVACAALA